MTRILYRWLLWLHPPIFRREFAGEMLWIFDEAAAAEGVATLFGDACVSLARQWLLRSGAWKVAVALAGALFQVTMGGALLFRIGRMQPSNMLSVADNPELTALLRIAVFTALGLLAAVMLLVFWWRKLSRRTEI
jgi:hypothetical protein